MTPVFSARRRAEEFDSLLEHSAGTDLTDARYADFLGIVSALRALPPVHARPEFVSSLREQLMVAAATELVPAEETRLALPARRPRDRRIAAAVGGFAIVGATTSMAFAAQTALPGDVLYPLKRAIENVESGISSNEGQKGVTMLANAIGRLDEVTALSMEGRLEDTPAIATTLNTFTEQATTASDLLLSDYADTGNQSSISDLRDFTSHSMETLAGLEDLVPTDAHDELLHAAAVLSQIDAEAEQACPTCGGDGITEIPKILAGATSVAGSGAAVDPVRKVTKGEKGDKGGSGKQDDPAVSEPGSALPSDPVIDPPSGSETTTASGDDDAAPNDPVGDLTDGLVNGGGDGDGTQPTSNPSGLPGVPDVDDDVTDGLTGNQP